MPTRKQRRRAQKERRHEYETVWVDAEGNELEEPPEEAAAPEKRERAAKSDGAKPRAKQLSSAAAGRVRVPPPPSWRRAAKRSLIFGVVIFAVFSVLGSKNGQHNYTAALALAVLYTLLFIPFTYYIDRFSYNRWQRRAEQQGRRARLGSADAGRGAAGRRGSAPRRATERGAAAGARRRRS